MSNILETWQFKAEKQASSLIVPDGCRDVIMCKPSGAKPIWFISPLFDHAEYKSTQQGTLMQGFRLKPGVRIDAETLLASINNDNTRIEIEACINELATISPATEEALACLQGKAQSIKNIAGLLGVSERTLQRLLLKETGRSPYYWYSLARARQTARTLLHSALPYDEIAYLYHYADQAHMCREIKKWFCATPKTIRHNPDRFALINDSGFN